MKKLLITILSLSTISCASIKYPGWEYIPTYSQVPTDKECTRKHHPETCEDDTETDAECITWYKKRATRYKSNAVVIINPRMAEYFFCSPIRPILKFDAQRYNKGSNLVTGQAFLKQKGGGVVTCAGNNVTIIPNTPYFTELDRDFNKEPSLEAAQMVKTTLCDAQGNFEFENVQDGEWIIVTGVTWSVPHLYGHGTSSFVMDTPQGGLVKKVVNVTTGQKNKFIITE